MYNLNYISVDYRRKWTQRLLRMKNTRIPKLVYEYIAAGRRNTERPRKDGETNTPEALSTYTQWLIIIVVVIIIIIIVVVVIVIVIMKKKMMMMVMVMTVQVYVSF